MRYPSLVVRASVAFMVAISVGACAATPTSPSPRETAPAASASVSATSSTDVMESPSAIGECGSVVVCVNPGRGDRSTAGSRSATGRTALVRCRRPVALGPRAHEPGARGPGDVRRHGTVPLNWMEYGYVTTGAGSVWQTDYDNDALVRIDPVTGKVVASIPVGSAPEGVAVTAGSVWVANEHNGSVQRVDPATNRVVATIPVGPIAPNGPQIMTAGPGGVWVGIQHTGEVVRVDAATNKVGLRVPLDGPVASDGKEVWIGVDAGRTGWRR